MKNFVFFAVVETFAFVKMSMTYPLPYALSMTYLNGEFVLLAPREVSKQFCSIITMYALLFLLPIPLRKTKMFCKNTMSMFGTFYAKSQMKNLIITHIVTSKCIDFYLECKVASQNFFVF